MTWIRQTARRHRAESADDSRPAQLLGRGHHRHRRRGRGVRVGAVDRRGVRGGDAGLGLARARTGDAKRARIPS